MDTGDGDYDEHSRAPSGKSRTINNTKKNQKTPYNRGGKSSKRNRRKPKSTRKHKKSINKKSTKKKVKKQKKTHKRR